MQQFCAKMGRVGCWGWFSVAVAVGCGETSKNGGGDADADGPSSGGSSQSTTTGTSTHADGGSTASSTNVVTAVSAGGASVATSTEGGVSTTHQVGGSGGSAGGGAEPECSSDDDCRLFSDCCSCAAYPGAGEAPQACPADCAEVLCEQHGIDQVRCSAGSCVLVTSHDCSALAITCDSLPPECPDGTLAGVGANRCWTGDCVPSNLCGLRPDCSSCADDEVCFRGFNDAFGTPYYCMPRPVTCSDQATCDCASQLCDELGFRSCTDADDGVMQCSP